MEMKIAAATALAELAREDVPDEVAAAYQGARPRFGREYIIPVPFDPRLISTVSPAVAKAAMETGVARKPIVDMGAYKAQLSARRDPIAGTLNRIFERVRRYPKRVVFAEGEEEQVIRARILSSIKDLAQPFWWGARSASPKQRPFLALIWRARISRSTMRGSRTAMPSMHNSFTSDCSGRAICSVTANA